MSYLDTHKPILESAWHTLLKFVLSEYIFLFPMYLQLFWMISVMGISTTHSLLPGRINLLALWLTITITQMWSCCMDHGALLYLVYIFSLAGLKIQRLTNMQLSFTVWCCIGLRILVGSLFLTKPQTLLMKTEIPFQKFIFSQKVIFFSVNVEVAWVITV